MLKEEHTDSAVVDTSAEYINRVSGLNFLEIGVSHGVSLSPAETYRGRQRSSKVDS